MERGVPAPAPHLVTIAEHILKHLRFKVHLAAYGDLARLAEQVENWTVVEEAVVGAPRTLARISEPGALRSRGKGMTAAVQDQKASFPDFLLLSRPKEPNYFDGPDSQSDLSDYRRRFFPSLEPEMVAGEASSQNLFVPFVAERIGTAAPEARLVAILRHPVDRAFSHWWMFHCFGWEPRSFGEAVRENLARLERGEGFDGPEGRPRWYRERASETVLHPVYVDYGHYADQIEAYLRHFPRDQMRLLLLEDLQRDRTAVLRDLFAFLGADPSWSPDAPDVRGERYNRRWV